METEDYEDMYATLSKRINGGNSHGILDELRKQFESHRILTIENVDKLKGATMDTGGNRWSVDYVQETSTAYFFGLIKRDNFFIKEVRIGLSRVPMAGTGVKMYSLYNDSYGGWVGVGKSMLRDRDVVMKKMIELTDELPF